MTKEQLLNELNNFIPFNEEEANDQKIIISLLKNNEDIVTRNNPSYHLTASAWVVNKDLTKVLLCYHNIYKSWSWTGGHADGEYDLRSVAKKEAMEETGIKHLTPLLDTPLSVEILTVDGHYKKGKYVSSHLHLNVTYLFIGDEDDDLLNNEEENKAVGFKLIDTLDDIVEEKWMNEHIYQKLCTKVKNKLSFF